MQNPRQVTEKFLDTHDFMMLVPEFLVRKTNKDPEELIMDMANSDLKTFEVMATADQTKYGLKKSEIKYFKPYILPVNEYPARYEALRVFIIETVVTAKQSKKIEFNGSTFSFEFDETDPMVHPDIAGIPNIKYFRIVRLMKEGEEKKMDVPDPSYFLR